MEKPVFLWQLEEDLYADERGELRQRLIQQLKALRLLLLARRRQLHEPEVYRRIEVALRAVEAALYTLHSVRVSREAPFGR
jgi:hypothetical protein